MNDTKYIGLDIHQATISAAVLDSTGKLVMESILETKAATILQFVGGLRGSVQVTLEEGTCAAWLHDLLKPHVANVVVCDPRKNALLQAGNKNDRIDARKLADLLRTGLLSPVYHAENGIRALRELARGYLALNRDVTRVMNRLKAVYRGWAIPCTGQRVYALRYRSEWLGKISEIAVRRRAEIYYQQLDVLRSLRQQVRRDLLSEGEKHGAMKGLRQIPSIGPIRAALLIALMQTPYRFRTKRQLWAYSGLALKTSTSGEYHFVQGQLKRSKKFLAIRGLNVNHNPDLKNIFKGAAIRAAAVPGPFQEFYAALVATGTKPAMARLTLARKIAAITLIVWKKGVGFDAEHLKPQAA
jgi:transposase